MSSSSMPSTDVNSQSSNGFSFGVDSANHDAAKSEFVDRRASGKSKGRGERRQFGSSHDGLSDDGRELALAIDQYKLENHRRYITCDEMLFVLRQLGYEKS